jgi:hypothetical protein
MDSTPSDMAGRGSSTGRRSVKDNAGNLIQVFGR